MEPASYYQNSALRLQLSCGPRSLSILFDDCPEDFFPDPNRLVAEVGEKEGARFRHLVNVDRFIEGTDPPFHWMNTDDLRLPDMIFTAPYKYNLSILKAFLDLDFEEIAFYSSFNRARIPRFFIKKKGFNQ